MSSDPFQGEDLFSIYLSSLVNGLFTEDEKKNEVTGSHVLATFSVSSVLTAILSADLSAKALATAEASAKDGTSAWGALKKIERERP